MRVRQRREIEIREKGELGVKGEMKKREKKNCLIKRCTDGDSDQGPNWSLFKSFICAW